MKLSWEGGTHSSHNNAIPLMLYTGKLSQVVCRITNSYQGRVLKPPSRSQRNFRMPLSRNRQNTWGEESGHRLPRYQSVTAESSKTLMEVPCIGLNLFRRHTDLAG